MLIFRKITFAFKNQSHYSGFMGQRVKQTQSYRQKLFSLLFKNSSTKETIKTESPKVSLWLALWFAMQKEMISKTKTAKL